MGKMKNELKVFRARFDLTQEQLAEKVGVTRQTIIAIEQNKYPNMSLLLAFRIARVFGVNIQEVFFYDEDEDY